MVKSNPYAWWQRPDLCYQDKKLVFAGHQVKQLAEQFGTPTFVYSAARIEANLLRIRQALNNAGLEGRSSIFLCNEGKPVCTLTSFYKAI